MKPYTIAIDAMGGDYGLEVTIPAALMALQQFDSLSLILVGDEALLTQRLQSVPEQLQTARLRIHHAFQQIEMDESPILALRNKRQSSMRVAIDLVKQGEADACVSAGNTGALMAIARFVLKTLPGIDRPAISALFPTIQPTQTVRLLDLGANVDVRTDHLFQFAVMGIVLAIEVDNIPNPRVALLNIGAEAVKGNAQVKQAGELLASKADSLNYVGYVEGNTLFQGIADVVICDGFVGNVALKVAEGVAKLMHDALKQSFRRNWLSRMAGLIAWPSLKHASQQMDPARYNGASLVGLQGIVIKSHGSADVQAFNHAIHRAITEIEKRVPDRIGERVTALLQKPL